MARGRKRQPPDSTEAPRIVQLRPSVTADENTETFYVNFVEVACNAYEYALLATRLPTKMPLGIIEDNSDGNFPVGAEVQLLLSPVLVDGLIDALTRQKQVYQQLYASKSEGEADA